MPGDVLGMPVRALGWVGQVPCFQGPSSVTRRERFRTCRPGDYRFIRRDWRGWFWLSGSGLEASVSLGTASGPEVASRNVVETLDQPKVVVPGELEETLADALKCRELLGR